ncbi:hypothetical protein [Flaviaesturariibacter terrae]
MFIPGILITILSFPGVIVHELARSFAVFSASPYSIGVPWS